MKKYLLLLILSIFFITPVKADTMIISTEYSKTYIENNTNFSLYTDIMTAYSSYSSTYPYYIVTIGKLPEDSNFHFSLFGVRNSSDIYYSSTGYDSSIYVTGNDKLYITKNPTLEIYEQIDYGILPNYIEYNNNGSTSSSIDWTYYDSNVNLSYDLNNFPFNEFNFTNFYSDSIIVSNGSIVPKLKDLLSYNSYSDYVSSQDYTIVDLNNYEYVILSLKNYSQTEPFQTNLQLKGQIGITPVYNYGRTSKDAITGSQVQDRCNLSYSDYTSYPFYILQSDLQNNAVYYVKSCEDNSSFKFDNTVFDVTYVTQSNLDNPTVTINGQTYNTIPYADLPSSATENENNNYIPGQSGSATDIGGLDSAIKSAQNSLSTIWNTITYFTDFVGLIFASLPVELRTILLSAFIITITIGIIKLFVGH